MSLWNEAAVIKVRRNTRDGVPSVNVQRDVELVGYQNASWWPLYGGESV